MIGRVFTRGRVSSSRVAATTTSMPESGYDQALRESGRSREPRGAITTISRPAVLDRCRDAGGQLRQRSHLDLGPPHDIAAVADHSLPESGTQP